MVKNEKVKVKRPQRIEEEVWRGICLIHGVKYQPPEVINEVSVEEYAKLGLTREQLLQMFEKMLRIRRFEEAVEGLFLVEGKLIGLCHPYFGMEAVAVGVTSALRPDDPIISTHRNHGHAIARGMPFKDLMAELFGKSTGTCKGLGGSMHVALSVEHNIPVVTAIVGSGIPIACGVGLALQYRKEKRIAVVFFGDGAVNAGAFNEGLNLATVWKLPILFVCENNHYALSTPFYKVCAGESIASRGAAYGIKSFLVPNANDVIAVYLAARKAVEHIRSGNGPAFIECRTYRMKGHGIYDTGWYRPKEEVEEWMKKDPIDIFMKKLKMMGILDDEALKCMEEDVEKEIKQAIDEAERAPVLDFDELWGLLYVGSEARYGEWR
jgi:TPP-dependent pyruvate/acetoin dehydrogenase alpha subunit